MNERYGRVYGVRVRAFSGVCERYVIIIDGNHTFINAGSHRDEYLVERINHAYMSVVRVKSNAFIDLIRQS